MHQQIEIRLERTTRPVLTGDRLAAERDREAALPERPSLARTRYALPLVREIRAVG